MTGRRLLAWGYHGRMKPENAPRTTLTCVREGCGWRHHAPENENTAETARYHAIQVHNDQSAVQEGRF